VHPHHQLVTHDSQTNDASDDCQEAPDNDYNTCLHQLGEASIQATLALDNKGDTLTQSQMFKTPVKEQFIQAEIPEINGLASMDVFEYHKIEDLPPTARLLSSIWSYCRKRRPNGTLLEYKLRICVDGSQQLYGRDYWETYTPVVAWPTICLVLLLTTIMNFKSRQVDYTQAFPQAELTDPVFMKIPQGWFIDTNNSLQQHSDPRFNDTGHYIKLRRNLHGCKQAARNWYNHLTQGILSAGFTQSKIDPCLFFCSDCLIDLYTDDTLIFAKEDATINEVVIKALSETYQLKDQGSVSDFLGIRLVHDTTTKHIHMTQLSLIELIIRDVGLTEFSNTKFTPSDSILHKDNSNSPREDTWHYRSVIGKLKYLAQNMRPDISFAVHQCA
jgi:hypothetical protein